MWTRFSQGSSLLATLGFETESLWDSQSARRIHQLSAPFDRRRRVQEYPLLNLA
jgi:hypothetical protein